MAITLTPPRANADVRGKMAWSLGTMRSSAPKSCWVRADRSRASPSVTGPVTCTLTGRGKGPMKRRSVPVIARANCTRNNGRRDSEDLDAEKLQRPYDVNLWEASAEAGGPQVVRSPVDPADAGIDPGVRATAILDGPERARAGAYRWRALLDSGAVVTNGTAVLAKRYVPPRRVM